MKPRILFSCLFICTGIGIISYPWLKAWYFERQKDHVIELWFDTRGTYDKAAGNTDKAFENADEPDFPEEDTGHFYDLSYVMNNMEGILTIEAIDLRTPILSEYSTYNLNLAICKLNGSSQAGDYGNYCLSGHKSRIYGRHFNRLKEVSIGDSVTVMTDDGVYHYLITETFALTAEDVWVLSDDFQKKQITLITCDYNQQPVGRFILRGEMLKEEVYL